jgi:L-lactate utilization protein LutB
MMGEADLAKEAERFREVRVNTTIRNLQRRGVNALYAPNREEALSIVLSMIPAGVTVARADSVTLFQIGIIPELIRCNQNKIIDPFPEA